MKTTTIFPYAMILALTVGTSCSSSEPEQSDQPTADLVSVPTEEAARDEAEKLITKDNFEDELAKLEQEVEQDDGEEP